MKQNQNKQYVEIPALNSSELSNQLTFSDSGQMVSVQEVEPTIMDLMGDVNLLANEIKESNQKTQPESKTFFPSICEALVDKVTQKKQIIEEYKEKKDPFWKRHKEIVKEEKEILSDIEKDEGKLREAVLEYLRENREVPKHRNISLKSSWDYRIEDPEKLPEKFVKTITVIDEKEIKKAVSRLGDIAEGTIPGIKVTEKHTVMVKSREAK